MFQFDLTFHWASEIVIISGTSFHSYVSASNSLRSVSVDKNASSRFSNLEKEYIRSNFMNLDDLSLKLQMSPKEILNLVSREMFPRPTYVFEDGIQWYPKSYVALMRRARRSRMTFGERFQFELKEALVKLKSVDVPSYKIVIEAAADSIRDDQVDATVREIWIEYQRGEFGCCLKNPTCGTIIKKVLLMNAITALTSLPNPTDRQWRNSLKQKVDELDKLETIMQTHYDRIRFGRPSSRELLITNVRRNYPDIFQSKTSR